MRNYKNIRAWQAADELAVSVYQITINFPKYEMYGLVSQLRRACLSVAANIVEGSARGHQKEYLHFLYIAYGSLTEVEYFLDISQRLNFIQKEHYVPVSELQKKTALTLRKLIDVVRGN